MFLTRFPPYTGFRNKQKLCIELYSKLTNKRNVDYVTRVLEAA